MDNLTICKRCGGDACYETVTDTLVSYWCMGCGFTTNTLTLKDSPLHDQLLESLPELYKDLLYEDEDGFVWSPSTINIPEKGMVFIDGRNKDDWQWAAMLSTETTKEERANNPILKNQMRKMDKSTLKYFKERDYMNALEYIGMFEK
jgi:hypothetical protein